MTTGQVDTAIMPMLQMKELAQSIDMTSHLQASELEGIIARIQTQVCPWALNH